MLSTCHNIIYYQPIRNARHTRPQIQGHVLHTKQTPYNFLSFSFSPTHTLTFFSYFTVYSHSWVPLLLLCILIFSSYIFLYFPFYCINFIFVLQMLSNQQSQQQQWLSRYKKKNTCLPTLLSASALSRYCRVWTRLQRHWLSAQWGVRHQQRLVQLHAARGQGLRQLPEMSEEIRLQLVVLGAS